MRVACVDEFRREPRVSFSPRVIASFIKRTTLAVNGERLSESLL